MATWSCPLDSALNTRKGFYFAQNKSRPLTDAMKISKDWLMSEMHSNSGLTRN